MTWMIIALVGYTMTAIAALFDKFLLSPGRIGSPALLVFYTSIFSLFALVMLPFGFVYFVPQAVMTAVSSGVLFILGLFFFYTSVKRGEVTRAVTLIGSLTVGYLFFASFLTQMIQGTSLDVTQMFALILLMIGGVALSYHTDTKKRDPTALRSVALAAALFAASLVLLRESYQLSNFASGFVWSRIGMVLSGLSLLLWPKFRQDIFVRLHQQPSLSKSAVSTGGYFILDKLFGGLGTFLNVYAISLGPVTFVQGLYGAQFAALFLLALPLSRRYPHIFDESYDTRAWVQKILGLLFLLSGIFVAVMSGTLRGFL